MTIYDLQKEFEDPRWGDGDRIKPFRFDGLDCAFNGHIIACAPQTPAGDDWQRPAQNIQDTTKNWLAMPPTVTTALDGLKTWAGDPATHVMTHIDAKECSNCRGSGKCECDCNNVHECGHCEGTGWDEDSDDGEGYDEWHGVVRRGSVYGIPVNAALVASVLRVLPGPDVGIATAANKEVLILKSGDVGIVLAAMRRGDSVKPDEFALNSYPPESVPE